MSEFVVDRLLGTDVEIRSFRIRGTRVHVTAPGGGQDRTAATVARMSSFSILTS